MAHLSHEERDQIIREFLGDEEERLLDHDAMVEMALVKLIQADEETLDFEPEGESEPHAEPKKPKTKKKGKK